MQKEYQLLIGCARRAVTGQAVQVPENVDWKVFSSLARIHGLEPMVYNALQDCKQLPDGLQQHLMTAYHNAIYKDTQFEYMRQQISQQLSQRNIRHIFLKGICLKHDYPVPALRTMSDIDVLVYAKDFEGLRQAMESLGGRQVEGDGNHRSYCFPPKIMVEFHPNLIHCASNVAAKINPGWQYARQDMTTAEIELTEEGFYLNILCHMADHFFQGGVGVRFVLDVWVCRHLRSPQPDRAFVERELEKFGLLQFAQKIETLAEAWFGDAPMTPDLEELGEYILTSGSHGNNDRAMLNAVCLSPGGSSASALWKKVFYPRQELEDRFDWVRGKPWLLPAAWTVRAWNAVTRRGGLILSWRKGTKQYSKEEIARQREKLERFGVSKSDN